MRIAFDAKRMFYNLTGLGNYSRSLVTQLIEHYPEDSYELFPFNSQPEMVDFGALPSAHIHRGNLTGAAARQWLVSNYLKELRVDVYHGLSNELPLNIRRTGVASVVTIHDLIFRAYPKTYSWPDRRIYDFKSRKACQNADQIIAVSTSTKEDIIAHYGADPGKITVIPPIVDAGFFTTPSNQLDYATLHKHCLPAAFALSVGTVEPRKNLENTLFALARINAADRLPLVVVGRGNKYLLRCKTIAQFHKLEVVWLENLTDIDELRALYRQAQFLIYPSKYEGFGMPVVEALLSGTPVLTSNTSSLPEAAGPGGQLIDPTDIDAIAEGIRALTQDAAFRDQLARDGRQYALATFSPEALTHRLRAVYQRVASS